MEKDISVQGLLRSPMRIEWEYDVNITSAMSLETVTKSPLSCSGYDGYLMLLMFWCVVIP